MDNRFGLQVPQADAPIVTTGGDHARVEGELRRAHPVRVALERLAELALVHVPDLHELVIGSGDEQAAVLVEVDRLDRSCVTTHNRAVRACIIVPHAHGGIARN